MQGKWYGMPFQKVDIRKHLSCRVHDLNGAVFPVDLKVLLPVRVFNCGIIFLQKFTVNQLKRQTGLADTSTSQNDNVVKLFTLLITWFWGENKTG